MSVFPSLRHTTISELSNLTLISCKTHITSFFRFLSGAEVGIPEKSKHPFLNAVSVFAAVCQALLV